jgi:hypothetical protein
MARLDIKLSDREKKILDTYCQEVGRSYTDVLREYIRTLEQKLEIGKDCS